jgi:hypothetical protein
MANLEKKVIDVLKDKLGSAVDNRGYFISSNPKDNLLEKALANWKEIRDELNEGAGNELTSKFCAVHSSSALCVNNFAPFKEQKEKFHWLGCSNFKEATFEKKQLTGLGGTPPHLDFYLEEKDTVIGVESKFTEYFTQKLPNHKNNLSEKYLDNEILSKYLPDGFNEKIIKYYSNENNKKHLDIAQLIKHSIGMIYNNIDKNKKLKLVYIYWQPLNEIPECQKHKEEIDEFKKIIDEFIDFINFIPMSYLDFWNEFENHDLFKVHIKQMRERYSFNL